MSNKNEVAKSTISELVVFNDMFGDVDFSTLNASIKTLAENNSDLSDEEKVDAKSIIREWEDNVIKRLGDRAKDVDMFLNFTKGKESYYYDDRNLEDELGIDGLALLASKTGTTEELEKYVQAKEDLETVKFSKPDEPIDDVTLSFEQRELQNSEFSLEETKYKIAKQKAIRKVAVTKRDWLKAMMSNEEMRKMVKEVTSYKRKLTRFKSECKAKSQNARLSISISSKEIRDALKDLLNFADKI